MQLENWAGEGTETIKEAIRKTLDYLYIYYNFEKMTGPVFSRMRIQIYEAFNSF
jgi:hypothetical protein